MIEPNGPQISEVYEKESNSIRNTRPNIRDDNVLVQGTRNDKNALGFFGLAYFTENQDKLKFSSSQ